MQGPPGRGDGGSAGQYAGGNFAFLTGHDPVFIELAASAERAFSHDHNTTLIKLRQLGEAMAQDIAARLGIEVDERTGQRDLLYRIDSALGLDPTVREFFHTLRIEGNRATLQFRTQHREAIQGLKVARSLAVWFHRALADQVEQQVANAQARVGKLTQSILAKAFRGELTAEWRAANPEFISCEHSSEPLLERIKLDKKK